MPATSGVFNANAVPPVLLAYHLMPEPVTTNWDKVALPQKVCVADPVGADVVFARVTVTANLVGDSHPEIDWEA